MATILGTSGNDLLTGTGAADSISGLAGNDTLVAGGGADTLDGGAGRNRAVIDASGQTTGFLAVMLAPAYASTIAGAVLRNIQDLSLTAGSGNDSLIGGRGDDYLFGGPGDDILQAGAGADTLLGGEGNDTILAGGGGDLISGGGGADLFVLQGVTAGWSSLAAPARIFDYAPGQGDRLTLRGQPVGGDVFPILSGTYALPGGTPLPVGFGAPLAPASSPTPGLALPDPTSGAGFLLRWLPDPASGGWLVLDTNRDGNLDAADLVVRFDLPAGSAITADDFLPGTLSVLGTSGADAITEGNGSTAVFGLGGNDTIIALASNDTLQGGDGDDSLVGGPGFASLEGGAGNDTLIGGPGTNVLVGGAGDDSLVGGPGDDLLQGGAGNDVLLGGAGNDSLVGGGGADGYVGGGGADTFSLQAMGEPAWSTLDLPAVVQDFSRAERDALRISDAWFGGAGGAGANAGTYIGTDGIARPLVFNGSTGPALATLSLGMALPRQPLGGMDAYQAYWVPAMQSGVAAGGWLVLDLNRNATLDANDLVVRLGSVAAPVTLAAQDFVPGTFLSLLAGGTQRSGTAGDDTLQGGSLTESFVGSLGQDLLIGGAGLGNSVSYAGFSAPVGITLTGYGRGLVVKPGGATDTVSDIFGFTGGAGNDTLDAANAGNGFHATTLIGGPGNDRLIGNGGAGVQVAYGNSPAAVAVNLQTGTATDGWGGTDTLVNIRRVAVTSAYADTVLGSAGDDIFLSGSNGSKSFDGLGGVNQWRYAGTGDITVSLGTTTPFALKPGGTDRLANIQLVAGGIGDDSILGSTANESFAGGPGNNAIDGGGGLDTVFYDYIPPGADLPTQGVVANLTTGSATNPWGGSDTLRRVENVWGGSLGDDLTGVAIPNTPTYLRGLAGNDTLQAPGPGTLVTADYAADPAPVNVNLATGIGRDGWGGTDVLVQIDRVRGSAFGDVLVGDANTHVLEGGAGNDTLYAGSGAATLDGGTGVDWLYGSTGANVFYVDIQTDLVFAQPGAITNTVVSTSNFYLYANIGTLILAPGAGNIFGVGNERGNLMLGNEGNNLIIGGFGDNTITGGDGNDTLYGRAGNDYLDGGNGADWLIGGDGNNTLLGGAGNDVLYGGAGRNSLSGGDGLDYLIAGSGDTTLDGGAGPDALYGGTGNNLYYVNSQADLVYALPNAASNTVISTGNYYLYANIGKLILAPGAGNIFGVGNERGDEIIGNEGNNLIIGGFGDNTISGGAGNDTLYGRDGDDRLDGGDGNDWLIGGGGDNTLSGGAGNDVLYGGAGHNSLSGGDGIDYLIAGSGDTTLDGGAGPDALYGGAGNNLYYVNTQADLVFAMANAASNTVVATCSFQLYANIGKLILAPGAGNISGTGNQRGDEIIGNEANNLIIGGAGDNTLSGGAGNDTLYGQAGNDRLDGGLGNDWLIGAAGDDTLDGGGGADNLRGGAGDDTFVFRRAYGTTVIADFTPGRDHLQLLDLGYTEAAQAMARGAQSTGGTIFAFGDGDFITLVGINPVALSATDFLFG